MSKADKDALAKGAAEIEKANKDKASSKPSGMEVHPVAKMFPLLPAKEMRELKGDIEANGIRDPIVVNRAKTMILDGRNRYAIAQDLGIEIPMETYKGKDEDIPGFILSKNVFRRHLTPDQRVQMIAKVRVPQLEKEAAERKAKKGAFGTAKAGDGKKGSVAEHVAAEAEVSVHKAKQAVKALKSGDSEAVINRKKTLKQVSKEQPSKPRASTKKEVTFEDQVVDKFDKWVKGFPHAKRTEAKLIVRNTLIEDPALKDK